jgi:hypothetical protein
MRVTTLGVELVLLHGEAPRRAGNEGHLRRRARFDLLLDVVAVQVQDDRPVRGPAQRHGIALPHSDGAHVLGHPPLLDPEVECDLRRVDDDSGTDRQADGEEQTTDQASRNSIAPAANVEPTPFPTCAALILLPLAGRG